MIDELRRIRPGEPCSHPGCMSHKSHPCEGCGRQWGDELRRKCEDDAREHFEHTDENKRLTALLDEATKTEINLEKLKLKVAELKIFPTGNWKYIAEDKNLE